MAFEAAAAAAATARHRRTVAAVALALCGVGAALGQWADSPRLVTLLALAALALLLLGRKALNRLWAFPPQALPDPGFGLPRDLAASRSALLALEAQLEFAPVALWRVTAQQVEPLNVAARRLLAPGAALDPAQLFKQLREAPAGQRSLVAYDSERGHERALVASSPLQVAGESSRLLALMPIESELETQTLAAWRQLVHVLTHEIMNSLTPIASLSRTAQDLLADRQEAATDPQQEDLATALDAIARRASHLVDFVGSYRSVSQWPEPRLQAVPLAALLAGVERLVAPAWTTRGGRLQWVVEPASLELMADPAQLEQVLINLAKNALEACAQTAQPQLDISARLARGGRLAIEVADNGPGVPNGLEARIFTPFFTTRDQGTGIGLAVVRNLIHGMGGTVRYAKRPSGGACFVLTF